MFLIIFLTALGIMHGYVGWKIFSDLDLNSTYALTAIILVIILTLLPVLPILFRYIGYESSLLDKLSFIGYIFNPIDRFFFSIKFSSLIIDNLF